MTENTVTGSISSDELKRQIEALATDIVSVIDVLTKDLQGSLLALADRVEQRMEAVGFSQVSGPVVLDIQEGVKAEAARFNNEARSKIREITKKKGDLVGSANELGALASLTATERKEWRERLQREIQATEKTRSELEEELAEEKMKLAFLENRLKAQSSDLDNQVKKLKDRNNELQAMLKKADDELLKTKEQAEKATETQDAAEKKINELEVTLKTEKQKITQLQKTLKELKLVKTQSDAYAKKIETQREEIATIKAENEQLSTQILTAEQEVKELKEQKLANVKELTELRHQAKMAQVKQTEMEKLSKEREDLIKQLATQKQKMQELEEEYRGFDETKTKLQQVEAKDEIQNLLLKKIPQYNVLTTLANKIVDGKTRIDAKELGFNPSFGVSIGAWIDKFFYDLKNEGYITIIRKAGGGLPSAVIEVTSKGKDLFEKAKMRTAL